MGNLEIQLTCYAQNPKHLGDYLPRTYKTY